MRVRMRVPHAGFYGGFAGPTRVSRGSQAGPRRVPRGSQIGLARAIRVLRQFGRRGSTRVLTQVLRGSYAGPTRVPRGPVGWVLVDRVGPLRRSQLCVESRKVEVTDTHIEDAPAGSRTQGTMSL